ncbi:reverse transcriptase domain-containing protein, partial [Tanacetum coccineum]
MKRPPAVTSARNITAKGFRHGKLTIDAWNALRQAHADIMINRELGDMWANSIALDKLDDKHVAMVNDSHNEDLWSKELRCLIAYNKAARDEELLLKQRAKVEWVSEVGNQFVKHFQCMLREKRNVDPILDPATLFINKLSNDDARFMVRPVLKEEIKEVIFAIIEDEVCFAIQDVFKNGKLLKEVNATIIALVPKSQTPQKVLSLMIRRRIEEDGDFTFHLITTIEEFSGVSGLIPNMEKSSVFFSDVHDGLKESILEVLPFSTRILPMNLSSQFLNDVCWGWKKILQCRDALRDHIVYRIGDGSTASIWFDNWLFLGPLSKYISKTDIFEAGLSLNCKVGHFSVKAAWSNAVVSKPVVPRYKLVWFSQNIPRHASIFWLAINQRLKTQDRIAVWQ